MPQLSDFYGLIIWIYWDEDKSKHKEPHIHAEYAIAPQPASSGRPRAAHTRGVCGEMGSVFHT